MLKIETNPSFWRQEKAKIAINGLDALRDDVYLSSQRSQAHPENMIARALSNFRFINEQVSPVVEGFYELLNTPLDFKKKFGLSPASVKLIIYNSEDLPNKLVYDSGWNGKPVEVTQIMLISLWNANKNRDAVEALAQLSKEQIIAKFKQHISSHK